MFLLESYSKQPSYKEIASQTHVWPAADLVKNDLHDSATGSAEGLFNLLLHLLPDSSRVSVLSLVG